MYPQSILHYPCFLFTVSQPEESTKTAMVEYQESKKDHLQLLTFLA